MQHHVHSHDGGPKPELTDSKWREKLSTLEEDASRRLDEEERPVGAFDSPGSGDAQRHILKRETQWQGGEDVLEGEFAC